MFFFSNVKHIFPNTHAHKKIKKKYIIINERYFQLGMVIGKARVANMS